MMCRSRLLILQANSLSILEGAAARGPSRGHPSPRRRSHQIKRVHLVLHKSDHRDLAEAPKTRIHLRPHLAQRDKLRMKTRRSTPLLICEKDLSRLEPLIEVDINRCLRRQRHQPAVELIAGLLPPGSQSERLAQSGERPTLSRE